MPQRLRIGHAKTESQDFATFLCGARQQQIQRLQKLHTRYLRLFPKNVSKLHCQSFVSEADQLTIGSDCIGVIPACRNILGPHLSEIRWHIASKAGQLSIASDCTRVTGAPAAIATTGPKSFGTLHCPSRFSQSRPTDHRF